MNELLSEAIGTFVLILFGCGVNAGTSLKNSYSKKESNSWTVGTLGWGLAVTLGVYASQHSGAHINPAVTFGLLSSGDIELTKAFEYLIGQSIGAFLACVIIYLHYLPHWSKTNDKKVKFSASNEESWFQWGNSTEILSETMPITEAIQKAINEGI